MPKTPELPDLPEHLNGVTRERELGETETRPGANGGGQLRTGNPGNKGGPGPTPSMMRMRHREKLNKALDATADAVAAAHLILRDKKSSRSMKLAAAQVIFKGHDALGKYSGTASVSLTDNDGNDVALPAMIVHTTPPKDV